MAYNERQSMNVSKRKSGSSEPTFRTRTIHPSIPQTNQTVKKCITPAVTSVQSYAQSCPTPQSQLLPRGGTPSQAFMVNMTAMATSSSLPSMPSISVNHAINFNSQKVNAVMSSRQSMCECDDHFIRKSKMHCISHRECRHAKKLSCDLCDICTDIKSINLHIGSARHEERHRQLMEYLYLLNLPNATQNHCLALSNVLEANYTRIGVAEQHCRKREDIVWKLNLFLKQNNFNACVIRLYGSSINGFALKTSDVNMDIVLPTTANGSIDQSLDSSATILSKVSDLIASNKNSYQSVLNEYNLKVPKVRFFDRHSKLECELSITAEKSYRTSILLQKYSSLDARVKVLCVALREWARICCFDDQENGTWPSIAFPIMVIHFLQRCYPPVLPCLHELLPNASNISSHDSAKPANATKNEENDAVEEELLKMNVNWRSQNNKSLGELWLSLLRYYCVDFDLETLVVSIRHTKTLETHADKNWSSRVFAIEDPFRPSLNLSRSVGSLRIYSVFVDQLRNTYKYFAIPYINAFPSNAHSTTRHIFLYNERDFEILVDQNDYYTNFHVEELIAKIDRALNFKLIDRDAANDRRDSDDSDDSDDEGKQKKSENNYFKIKRLIKTYGIRFILKGDIDQQIFPKENYVYNFNFARLTTFKRPPKFCRLCRRYGHQQNRCPDERLPDLIPLAPQMHAKHINILENICIDLFTHYRMTENEENLFSLVMDDLSTFIREKMPLAKLELFGSTKNGFGAKHCDLDICLTFENNETGENLNFAEIIETVSQILRYHPRIIQITPITSAKVPIVKFSYVINHSREKIDCDISLYNLLARYNTMLLKAYCNIDNRVQMLGFVVKYFAKTCDIGDASRGSLSSYAYILMTLHFLQQKGIIPVLQEIGLNQKYDRIIDGWDTWYFDDLRNLSKVWNKLPNNQTVAELFLEFLRYYSEIFNYDENVVCCRQLAPLKRLEKMWTGRKMAIEDPFLLCHNLGAGVDNQMATFIKTAIIKGRNNIGIMPPENLPSRYKHWAEYFFDRNTLTQGRPPTGRGCRLCGRIGHKFSKCPEKPERPQQKRAMSAKNTN